MLTRKQLDEYLAIFELAWPAEWSSVQAAHREQVSVWHPDRFHDANRKVRATERLKKLNTARDALASAFKEGLTVCDGCEQTLRVGESCASCASRAAQQNEAERVRREHEALRRQLDEEKRRLEKEKRRLEQEKRELDETKTPAPSERSSGAPALAGTWLSADGSERWEFSGRDPNYAFTIHPAIKLPFVPVGTLGNGVARRVKNRVQVEGQLTLLPFFPQAFQLELTVGAGSLQGLIRDGFLVRQVLLVRA